jgi:predicted nucleotidyltransferase
MDLKLPRDFKEFLRSLESHGVEYLLIGGYAVGYHGYPRATQDLDVWVSSSPSNAKRMVVALREFGFGTPNLTTDLFLKDSNVVRMGRPPMRIDMLTTISGVDFDECYAARVNATMDDVTVPIINLHHLRINKKASGRHRDLDDLEHLPKRR